MISLVMLLVVTEAAVQTAHTHGNVTVLVTHTYTGGDTIIITRVA